MTTTGSIAEFVKTRIEELPTSAGEVGSGTIIQGFIEYAKIDVQNYTGDTISNDNVPEKYANILADLGEAYARARLANAGVQFQVSQGPFNLSRGADSSVHAQRARELLEKVNRDLKSIGKKTRWKKVYG